MKKRHILLVVALCGLGAMAVLGQGQGQPPDPNRMPGLQGPQDPNHDAFIMKNCKDPAAAPQGRGGAAGRGPGGGAAAAPPSDSDYTIAAIPGVISAGAKWKILWRDKGNNADGIVAWPDGSVWLAQNDNSDVVSVDKDGNAKVVYKDTYTGGSLAANPKGEVFIGERALGNAVWLLKPQRKLFANMINGEPYDCVGGIINDMVADAKGGVYMTMGGIYYVNPQGVTLPRQDNPPVGGNGIMLSPDGKTLYATGRMRGAPPPVTPEGALGTPPPAPPAGAAGGRGPGANGGLVAWDVQPDGSLTNERQFADVCGDGGTVDNDGRVYCTGVGMGLDIVDKTGKYVGRIPAPRGIISLAFGGPNKKTLYAVAIRDVEVMSIPMEVAGNKSRPK